MTFAERAKPLKDSQKITLRELAEACHISESTASRYLSGALTPTPEMAAKILAFLGAAAEDASPVDLPDCPGGVDESTMDSSVQMLYYFLQQTHAEQARRLAEALQHERREKYFFIAVLAVVMAVILFILIYDFTHGTVGWIRTAVPA